MRRHATDGDAARQSVAARHGPGRNTLGANQAWCIVEHRGTHDHRECKLQMTHD